MRPNQQNDLQWWYKWHQHLSCRFSGLIIRSTDWLHYRWRIRFTENWQSTKLVWPPSLLRSKLETTGLSVLNPYLFSGGNCWYQFDVFSGYVWSVWLKINNDNNEWKKYVMRNFSFVVLIWSEIFWSWIISYHLPVFSFENICE